MKRAIEAIAVGIALCLLLGQGSPLRALEATEPAIKAAFLYKFGFFVEWPDSSFASGDSPINLCVVGDDAFGALLEGIVKGKRIGSRAIAVRRATAVARNSGCHILYLSGDADSQAAQMLDALKGSGVLTVTDDKANPGNDGIIRFVIRDNRVRFDIDDAAAAAGGLVIDSRLLNLALEVKPRH